MLVAMRKNRKPILFLIIIVIIAIILSLLDFGDFVNNIVPSWILLFYSYYIVNYKVNNIGFIALFIGVIIDIIIGNIVGQTSLALILSSYFVYSNKHSILISNVTTNMVLIFVAGFIYLFGMLSVHVIIQGFDISYTIFISPLIGAIVYPFISVIFHRWR